MSHPYQCAYGFTHDEVQLMGESWVKDNIGPFEAIAYYKALITYINALSHATSHATSKPYPVNLATLWQAWQDQTGPIDFADFGAVLQRETVKPWQEGFPIDWIAPDAAEIVKFSNAIKPADSAPIAWTDNPLQKPGLTRAEKRFHIHAWQSRHITAELIEVFDALLALKNLWPTLRLCDELNTLGEHIEPLICCHPAFDTDLLSPAGRRIVSAIRAQHKFHDRTYEARLLEKMGKPHDMITGFRDVTETLFWGAIPPIDYLKEDAA